MPHLTLGAALPVVMGGLGLLQQSQANSNINKGISAAKAADAPKIAAQNKLLGLADAYDPNAEMQYSIDQATAQTAETLRRSLGLLGGDYRLSGGTPGNSTAFNVRAQRATDQTLGPFATWVAQQKAGATQKKAAMYNQVFNASPGQTSDAYFKAAQLDTGAPTASIQLMAQGIDKIIGQKVPTNTGGIYGEGDSKWNIPVEAPKYGSAGSGTQAAMGSLFNTKIGL
jgi:hypothetical protein